MLVSCLKLRVLEYRTTSRTEAPIATSVGITERAAQGIVADLITLFTDPSRY